MRHVAEDAGVNVALINRYFGSKQGLFAACLEAAVTELRYAPGERDLAGLAARIAGQAAGLTTDHGGPRGDVMLMLLRSSGDADVDALRRSVLRGFSEQVAALLDPEGDPDGALLRAQVVLAAALGIAVLRASPGLEPLRSAGPDDLTGALLAVLSGLAASTA